MRIRKELPSEMQIGKRRKSAENYHCQVFPIPSKPALSSIESEE
jgi:hypothetical protein